MEKVFAQHGDVTLREVGVVPATAKKIKINGNRFVVEKGEGNHEHVLEGEKLSDKVEIYQDGETLFLKVKEEVSLNHEEHGVQTLEPNKIYRKIIEREWDYEATEARNTAD